MVKNDDRMELPGREIPKEYREVVTELVRNQGWRYRKPSGGGYPQLLAPDRSVNRIRVPMTPSDRAHGFKNWIAEIRRAGGKWPPEGR